MQALNSTIKKHGIDSKIEDNLACVGINAESYSLDAREKVARISDETVEALARRYFQDQSYVLIKTCLRMEIVTFGQDAIDEAQRFFDELLQNSGVETQRLAVHKGKAVVRHLIQLQAGLESFVCGEAQISGQVRRAFSSLENSADASPELQTLYRISQEHSSKIREHFHLDRNAPSLGRLVAQEVANEPVQSSNSIIVIGTGDVARDVVSNLCKIGCRERIKIYSASSANRASEFAELMEINQDAVIIDQNVLRRQLGSAQFVIAASSADFLLTTEDLDQGEVGMCRFLDLGNPPNIDINIPKKNLDQFGTLREDRERLLSDASEEVERGVAAFCESVEDRVLGHELKQRVGHVAQQALQQFEAEQGWLRPHWWDRQQLIVFDNTVRRELPKVVSTELWRMGREGRLPMESTNAIQDAYAIAKEFYSSEMSEVKGRFSRRMFELVQQHLGIANERDRSPEVADLPIPEMAGTFLKSYQFSQWRDESGLQFEFTEAHGSRAYDMLLMAVDLHYFFVTGIHDCVFQGTERFQATPLVRAAAMEAVFDKLSVLREPAKQETSVRLIQLNPRAPDADSGDCLVSEFALRTLVVGQALTILNEIANRVKGDQRLLLPGTVLTSDGYYLNYNLLHGLRVLSPQQAQRERLNGVGEIKQGGINLSA